MKGNFNNYVVGGNALGGNNENNLQCYEVGFERLMEISSGHCTCKI